MRLCGWQLPAQLPCLSHVLVTPATRNTSCLSGTTVFLAHNRFRPHISLLLLCMACNKRCRIGSTKWSRWVTACKYTHSFLWQCSGPHQDKQLEVRGVKHYKVINSSVRCLLVLRGEKAVSTCWSQAVAIQQAVTCKLFHPLSCECTSYRQISKL